MDCIVSRDGGVLLHTQPHALWLPLPSSYYLASSTEKKRELGDHWPACVLLGLARKGGIFCRGSTGCGEDKFHVPWLLQFPSPWLFVILVNQIHEVGRDMDQSSCRSDQEDATSSRCHDRLLPPHLWPVLPSFLVSPHTLRVTRHMGSVVVSLNRFHCLNEFKFFCWL